jgi:hypothetical protein
MKPIGYVREMSRVFGVLAVAAIWLAVGLGIASIADAAPTCTCGSLEGQADRADAVFIGTVRDISVEADGPAGREVLWNVEVERSFVGPDASVIAVSTGGELSNCRAELEPGTTYGVVAFWRSGHLATSRCGIVTPGALESLMAPSDQGAGGSTIMLLAGVAFVSFGAVAFIRIRRVLS